MIRFIFLLLIIFGTVACNKSGKKEDVLPRPKMERIIWDMILADEYVQSLVRDTSKTDLNTERYKRYQQVFQLHNITKEQFKKSYDYYASHPAESKVLFDSLAARSNRRLQEAYKSVK